MTGTTRYEVVTCNGHVLARVGNAEDARDVAQLLATKLRRQGFSPPPYPARLVYVQWVRPRETAPTV